MMEAKKQPVDDLPEPRIERDYEMDPDL